VTATTYSPTSNQTNTYPDLGTRVEVYYSDGRPQYVFGTAVFGKAYGYGAGTDRNGNICTYTAETNLTSSGAVTGEWTKTYVDWAGRTTEVLYADGSYSQFFYNGNNQLYQQVDPDGVTSAYTYNAKNECVLTALDPSGFNRLTFVTNDVVADHGVNVRRSQTYVWSTGANSSNLISTVETSADGLRNWNMTWNGGAAVTNQTATVYSGAGARSVTATAPDNSSAVSLYSYGQLSSVTSNDANGNPIGGTTYGYDIYGRQNTSTDARNGTTTNTFNNADQVATTTTPNPGTPGGTPEVTTTYYDVSLRATNIVLPDNTSVSSVFYPNGLLQLTYGSRTYAAGYSYDAQGRMKTMTNWSNFASQAGPRVTTWNYDPYRGWLTNKTYNGDVAGPAYTYTPAGRLQTRLWARGVTTTYAYTTVGDLYTVTYSDGTPGLTYAYDRRGRPATITQGSGATTTLAYNDPSQLLSESYGGASPLAGLTITNAYDQYLRRYNLSLNSQPSALSFSYGYDAASRLQTVSDGANNFATYSYVAKSPLIQQIVFAGNGTTRMTTTNQYDFLNRLTQISSMPSAASTLSFSYGYNSANQRAQDTLADNSYWAYGYDALGQVISGKKYWSDGTAVSGQQFQYQFDTIGNRTGTDSGGDVLGANLHHAVYTPDASGLNQYANRQVPGYAQSLGMASASANVVLWTTNSGYGLSSRKGTYFRAELPVNNTNGPLWLALTNVALVPGGASGTDVVSSAAGNLFAPQTPEQYTYDADGNLKTDGRWTYTWDAENRLIDMTSLSGAPSASLLKLDFSYDYKGRRIQKDVSTWNGSA
jgi:YD repeat-containing protein